MKGEEKWLALVWDRAGQTHPNLWYESEIACHSNQSAIEACEVLPGNPENLFIDSPGQTPHTSPNRDMGKANLIYSLPLRKQEYYLNRKLIPRKLQ